MDDLSQVSDEQLQATYQARVQEVHQKAADAPLPDKSDLSKLSDEELQTAALGHQIRNEQLLAPVRQQVEGEGVSGGAAAYLGRAAISPIRGPLTTAAYAYSKNRLNKGEYDEGDLRNIALYEREQRIGQEQPESVKWAGVAAAAPGTIATLGFGGAGGLALKAATIGGGAVAGAAAEQGVAPWDPQAVLKGGATAGAQLAILHALGPLAEKVFPGAQSVVAKAGATGATGAASMAVTDYATKIVGLTEQGGAIQDLIEGKYGEAGRNAAGNFLMTAGLGAADAVRKGISQKAAVNRYVEATRVQAEAYAQSVDQGKPTGPPAAQPEKSAPGEPPSPGTPSPADATVAQPWAPERVAEMRDALIAVGAKAKQWSPEKVQAEAQKLGLDRFQSSITNSPGVLQDGGEKPADFTQVVDQPPDRRVDAARRQQVAEMSPEEMRKELLTSKLTDLPNRRAFDEAPPAPAVGMSDADGLKALNDKFGYEAGDALLRAKGEALKEAGLDAYHEKGDEFLYRGGSAEEIRSKLERARSILKDKVIEVTLTDGTVKRFKGADFSYGTGQQLGQAEAGLKAHKSEREARGERARGELRGIVEVGPEAGQVDQGGAARPDNGPAAQTRPEVIPITAATRPGILDRIDRGEGNLSEIEKSIATARVMDLTPFRELAKKHNIPFQTAANLEKSALKKLGYSGSAAELHGQQKMERPVGQKLGPEFSIRSKAEEDVHEFNPPDEPDRVAELMRMGYSRTKAEERARSESAPRQERAMGAAALGELTGGAEQSTDPRLTSLSHAQSKETRRALDLAAEAKRQGYPDEMVYEASRALVQADPEYPNRLIAELEQKNRPTDPIETAVLLRENTRFANEIDRARTVYGDDPEGQRLIDDLKAQHKRLLDVTDPAGSAAGAAFRLRRALMDEDYTIVGLERRAEAAKGKPLTDAEKAEIAELHDKLRKAEAELERLRAEQGGKKPGKPGRPDPAEIEPGKIKDDINDRIKRLEDENKPWWAKALDKSLDVQRFSILSGGQTIEKLGSAAVVRVLLAPIRQAVAAGLGKLPFVRQVAAQSPRWGRLSRQAEVDAVTSGLLIGLRSAKERSPFGPGRSAADVAYGENKYPRKPGVLNRILAAPGEVHGAMKAVPFENEFTRSAQMRTEFYRRRGMNTDTVAMQDRIGKEAYKDAEESIFQRGPGDWVADKFNGIVRELKAKDKDGNYSPLSYLGGTALKSRVPILRVPLNIVGESLRGIFGTLTGSAGVADAIARGVKDLPPERADLIMKRLTDGTIGATFVTLGALGYASMGGLYVEGDRRHKKVPEGQADVFGVEVPKEFLHDPRLQLMQAGATAVQQSKRYAKGEPQGLLKGVGAAFGATLREVPFVREMEQTNQFLNPSTQGTILGEMAKSFALPQLIQWVARELDKPHPFMPGEEPKHRKAKGFIQTIQKGLPGLRESLPAAEQ